jgi:outer membrane murein-binding lipoprotein Lpp
MDDQRIGKLEQQVKELASKVVALETTVSQLQQRTTAASEPVRHFGAMVRD